MEVFIAPNHDQTWSVYSADGFENLGKFNSHEEAAAEFIKQGARFTHPAEVDEYRVCSWTGKVITSGFCIGDGSRYTDDSRLATNYLRGIGYPSTLSDQDVLDAAYEEGMCYYTEWE